MQHAPICTVQWRMIQSVLVASKRFVERLPSLEGVAPVDQREQSHMRQLGGELVLGERCQEIALVEKLVGTAQFRYVCLMLLLHATRPNAAGWGCDLVRKALEHVGLEASQLRVVEHAHMSHGSLGARLRGSIKIPPELKGTLHLGAMR